MESYIFNYDYALTIPFPCDVFVLCCDWTVMITYNFFFCKVSHDPLWELFCYEDTNDFISTEICFEKCIGSLKLLFGLANEEDSW